MEAHSNTAHAGAIVRILKDAELTIVRMQADLYTVAYSAVLNRLN